MRTISEIRSQAAYAGIAIGVIFGVCGLVLTGAILIAVGTGVIALSHWEKRRIERYLPLAIAIVLLGLAIALPKGL